MDGKERLARSATRVFCLLDETDLVISVDEAERMVVAVAAGRLGTAELAVLSSGHLSVPGR